VQEINKHHLTGPDDPILASISLEDAERYRVFWNYLDVQRRVIMGLPVSETELKKANHQVDDYYEKWFPLGKY
jgi:hypothetical protein